MVGSDLDGYTRVVKQSPHTCLILLASAAFLLHGSLAPAADEMLPSAKRVLFLGDSITHSGQYVDAIEAYFVTRFPRRQIEFLNLGLPSETVAGLSGRVMRAANSRGRISMNGWRVYWKRSNPKPSSPVTG